MVKKILIVSTLILCAGISKAENIYKQKVGNFEFYSGDQGYQATKQRVGGIDFITDNNGNSATVQHIGNVDYISTQEYKQNDRNGYRNINSIYNSDSYKPCKGFKYNSEDENE